MGMYDTVYFKCPHCGAANSVQSKAGDCALYAYGNHRVPMAIAGSLNGSSEVCSNCMLTYRMEIYAPTDTVQMRAVKS
jgi:transcription elongation factor Elf1